MADHELNQEEISPEQGWRTRVSKASGIRTLTNTRQGGLSNGFLMDLGGLNFTINITGLTGVLHPHPHLKVIQIQSHIFGIFFLLVLSSGISGIVLLSSGL